jgi:hypothetical protein
LIDRYAAVFDRAFPARTLDVRRWLHEPDRDLRGIWFLLINAPDIQKGCRGGSTRVRIPGPPLAVPIHAQPPPMQGHLLLE